MGKFWLVWEVRICCKVRLSRSISEYVFLRGDVRNDKTGRSLRLRRKISVVGNAPCVVPFFFVQRTMFAPSINLVESS